MNKNDNRNLDLLNLVIAMIKQICDMSKAKLYIFVFWYILKNWRQKNEDVALLIHHFKIRYQSSLWYTIHLNLKILHKILIFIINFRNLKIIVLLGTKILKFIK